MIALIWNCGGLGHSTTVRTLRETIISHRPVIVFLSEVKISDPSKTHSISTTLGFSNSYLVPSRGKSGGLLLLLETRC